MSMQVVSQDHYTTEVAYAPGRYTYTKEKVGTRYVFMIIRMLADPQDPDDMKAANEVRLIVCGRLSSGIRVERDKIRLAVGFFGR